MGITFEYVNAFLAFLEVDLYEMQRVALFIPASAYESISARAL